MSQYVEFARLGNEAIKKHGRTRKAAIALVEECVRRGVLVDYLVPRRGEVEDIMFTLFDEEEVLKRYYRELEQRANKVGMAKGMEEGLQQGMQQGMQQGLQQGLQQGEDVGRKAVATNLLAKGMDARDVAELCGLTLAQIEELAAGMLS